MTDQQTDTHSDFNAGVHEGRAQILVQRESTGVGKADPLEILSVDDACLLEQAASLLEDMEETQNRLGNNSIASGAGCSAHAVRRLAVALMQIEREQSQPAQCLQQSEPLRTSMQIVEQTEALAVKLMTWCMGLIPETSAPLRHSQHPKAMSCWQMACEIQELLTDTDPENAVADVDDEIDMNLKAEGEQP